jgi:hypothetical protein
MMLCGKVRNLYKFIYVSVCVCVYACYVSVQRLHTVLRKKVLSMRLLQGRWCCLCASCKEDGAVYAPPARKCKEDGAVYAPPPSAADDVPQNDLYMICNIYHRERERERGNNVYYASYQDRHHR